MTTILETINSPADLKKLSIPELKQLANELRTFIIDNVSKTGGHLSSSLGTVELAIAIHYVFDTPEDRLVWDVGHQAYAHKILTGRRDRMPTLRQYKGLSGRDGPAVERARRADQQHKAGGHGQAEQFSRGFSPISSNRLGLRPNYEILHCFLLLKDIAVQTKV